jgi:hypothetical protein
MVRIRRAALTFCIFSIGMGAQEATRDWFPFQVGSRWVYEHESKSGDRNRPTVTRWTTEETLTERVTVPEGVVVLREATQLTSATGYTHSALDARDREPYLVSGNCVYVINGGWDSQRHQLRQQYRKYLSDGALSPDFCFPLQRGSHWGNNDVPWRVEPARTTVESLLPANYAGAVHIFSDHFGSGGLQDVWFQKGVGVVLSHYAHDGTYDEYTKKLLSFQP